MTTNVQQRVAVRLPQIIIKRIEKISKADGSTLSQFLRTAAIEKLNRANKLA